MNDNQEIIKLQHIIKEYKLSRLNEQNEYNKMLKLKSEEISCLNQELNTMKTKVEANDLRSVNLSKVKIQKIKDNELAKRNTYVEDLKRKSEEISSLKRELSTIRLTMEEYVFNFNKTINLEIQKNKKENKSDKKNKYIKELEQKSQEISDLKEKLHAMKVIIEEHGLKNEFSIKNYIRLTQENMLLKSECNTTFETIKYEMIMFKTAFTTLKSNFTESLEKLKIDMTHDDQTLKIIEENKVLLEALGKIRSSNKLTVDLLLINYQLKNQ